MTDAQTLIDRFYDENGPCCAGCDWWRWINSVVGECSRSAPVSAGERLAMLEMRGVSIAPAAGHVLTRRAHLCGEFKDERHD